MVTNEYQGLGLSQRSGLSVSVNLLQRRMDEDQREASISSVGDSCDKALAELINDSDKNEVIDYYGPWKSIVDWFNNQCILEPVGNIPPIEYELMYYQQLEESSGQYGSHKRISGFPRAVQSENSAHKEKNR